MPATAAPAPPPPGFEVVTPKATASEPQRPVVKVKEATAPAIAAEPAAAAEAPAVAASAPAEDGYDKAKIAAKKAKEGAAANRRIREQGVQLQQQLERQSHHTATLESQLRQATQHLDHVMKDPLGAMKALGVTPQDLAKRVAMDGSPEGQIEALRAELLDTKRRLDAQAEAAREQESRTKQAQIENSYKQEAQNGKKYPNLASVHPDFVLSRTKDIVGQLWTEYRRDPGHFQKSTGRSNPSEISNHEYLVYLNDSYAPKAAAQEPAATTDPAPETSGKKTATITNQLASTKHAVPPDFSKMSDRQQKKVMAQQFRDLGLGH